MSKSDDKKIAKEMKKLAEKDPVQAARECFFYVNRIEADYAENVYSAVDVAYTIAYTLQHSWADWCAFIKDKSLFSHRKKKMPRRDKDSDKMLHLAFEVTFAGE